MRSTGVVAGTNPLLYANPSLAVSPGQRKSEDFAMMDCVVLPCEPRSDLRRGGGARGLTWLALTGAVGAVMQGIRMCTGLWGAWALR
jgi:hypothetical protein